MEEFGSAYLGKLEQKRRGGAGGLGCAMSLGNALLHSEYSEISMGSGVPRDSTLAYSFS